MSHMFVSVSAVKDKTDFPVRDTIRYDQFVHWLMKPDTKPMMASHIGLGICGEAGELADAIKREYHYKKPRTKESLDNVIEELGDLMFYITAACNHYGLTLQSVLQANAHKLEKRYVDLTYSDNAAIARADKASPIG